MTGKFITFEGIDGAGKGSQIKLLYDHLTQEDFEVVQTREPGGTMYAEALRDFARDPSYIDREDLAELLVFEAARADHVGKLIGPSLKKGKIVVCDRYTDSSLTYQGYGRGMDLDLIRTLNEIATDGLEPDLTLLFDVELGNADPIDQAIFEQLGSEYMERVREGYLELARENPDRIEIVRRFPASTQEESIEKTFYNRTLPLVLDLLGS
ncbi:MAG: dTMP kinase [Nanoarchaeota archaeon]|nr:dTMP kinase [Nanoarchaeota archaeon]|tara:strand:- start:228 stop:857 length:630 start_codon:yes stop_codon:yes gene_type:complete